MQNQVRHFYFPSRFHLWFCDANYQTSLQCWALPQIGPLIRKLQTQGFGLQICEPIAYRKHLWNCGRKIEIYRKSTTSLGSLLFNFQKYTFLRFNVSTDLGGCIYKVQHPLTKFLSCGTTIFFGCCQSYSKMSYPTRQEVSNGLFFYRET